MFSTSTILLRTVIDPRWIAFLGYALGAALLLSVGIILWVPLVFPIWVLLISIAILLENPSNIAEPTSDLEAMPKEVPSKKASSTAFVTLCLNNLIPMTDSTMACLATNTARRRKHFGNRHRSVYKFRRYS